MPLPTWPAAIPQDRPLWRLEHRSDPAVPKLYLSVSGAIEWSYDTIVDSRIAVDLCGGTRTQIVRTDATASPKRSVNITVFLGNDADRIVGRNAIKQWWQNGGPFVAVLPHGEEVTVFIDQSAGLVERWESGFWWVELTLLEQ